MIGSHKCRRWRELPRSAVVVLGFALALLAGSSAEAYPPMIGRAALDGSDADYAFIKADTAWLAADDQHIYWSNHTPDSHAFRAGSSIGRANLDGTGVDPTFIPQPADSVYGVAVDSEHVYWIRWSGRLGDATIARANLNGTDLDPSFITGIGGIVAAGLAVDGSHIYWAHNYWIGRANLDGSGVDPEFISEYNTGFWDLDGGVAAGDGHVYWSQEDQDETAWIARAHLDGTGLEPTFRTAGWGGGETQLAADSAHLYWGGPHGIARSRLDGTGADLGFVPGPGPSMAMAVNSSQIFWSRPEAKPAFILHKPKCHRRRGTATLPMDVIAGPGELVLTGRGLRTITKEIDSGSVAETLYVKPRGQKRHRLTRRGHVRVTAHITFTMTGADSRTRSKSLKLVKR
jgi:hypothetical protein